MKKFVVIIFLFILVLSGCAAIRKNSLKARVNNESSKQITYSISFVGKSNDKKTQDYKIEDDLILYLKEECLNGKLKNYRASFKEKIVWARFACELDYNFNKQNKMASSNLITSIAQNGIHLNILYEQNVFENKALVYLGYLSLFLVPFKNEIQHKWTTELYKDGKLIKKYFHDDGFDVWHSIFLIPVSPFLNGYNRSISDLNKTFVENIIFDLQKDNYL